MTQGKRQRSEGTNFLGLPFRKFTCSRCKGKYEDFGLDKGTICPPCANPKPVDEIIDDIDMTQSHDQCMRDFFQKIREEDDKCKDE